MQNGSNGIIIIANSTDKPLFIDPNVQDSSLLIGICNLFVYLVDPQFFEFLLIILSSFIILTPFIFAIIFSMFHLIRTFQAHKHFYSLVQQNSYNDDFRQYLRFTVLANIHMLFLSFD